MRYDGGMQAAIVGIAGPTLLADEAALFCAHPPAGVILFARNIHAPPQLGALIASLRRVLPHDAVLMVDQEGGRVARLRPPHWRAHPPAAALGRRFAASPAAGLRAAFLTGALIGLTAPPPASMWWPRRCSIWASKAPATWSATAPSRRIR